MLSNFAFNSTLRRYIEADVVSSVFCGSDEVGGCRLTVSKPMLKAPMLSALESVI